MQTENLCLLKKPSPDEKRNNPDDVLLPEEELALAEAERDIKNGDIYTHEEAWA